jgi:hypothetical protein
MKNRIKIDGVWYVREKEMSDLLVTKTQEYLYEAEGYEFKFFKIYKDDGVTFYPSPSLDITNHTTKESEYWDNDEYLRDYEAEECSFLTKEAALELERFLDWLKDKGEL